MAEHLCIKFKIMKIRFIPLALMLSLAGCSNKVFKPLYTSKPQLNSPRQYDLIKERRVPEDTSFTLTFALNDDAKPDENEYFNNPGAKKSINGKQPSVIIAPPKEIEVRGKKVKEFEEDQNSYDKIFRTDGYYNEAEQVIEKALLRIGFNVLDRSKFEAKLRDLRDRANERPWWYQDWTEDLLESGEYDVLKDQYKKQLESGIITPAQYAEIINEVDKQSQRGLPGKKREEDEMNDIAEVIRAAQTGADQADYLLQISEVTVVDAGDRYLRIKENEKMLELVNQHHGLKFGDLPHGLPSSIPSSWFRASFNAKLIEIKTGSIVWIGSHEIESAAAEPIEISFDIDKNVSNEDEINGDIQLYNRKIINIDAEIQSLHEALSALYDQAMKTKKMGSPDELSTYTEKLKREIKQKEVEYHAKVNSLNSLLANPPIVSSKNWEYTYDISKPFVQPNLLTIGKEGIQGEQRLLQHRKELIEKVIQELIKTIKIY